MEGFTWILENSKAFLFTWLDFINTKQSPKMMKINNKIIIENIIIIIIL